MRKQIPTFVLVHILAAATTMGATALLHEVEFPERKTVELSFATLPGAPEVRLRARVRSREGLSRIDLSHDPLKPAVLHGGDVTSWVMWAVSRDGTFENLGEIGWAPKGKQTLETARVRFALLVTAESYALADRPSTLAAYANVASDPDRARSRELRFELGPSPKYTHRGIALVAWDPDTSGRLAQARRLYELAGRYDADDHAGGLYAQAGAALNEATARKTGNEMEDAAARSAALSNEAIRISLAALEDIRLREERAEARRKQKETELRAERAEERARENRAEADQLALEVAVLRDQRETLRAELAELSGSKSLLEDQSAELRGRLRGALSQVASTEESARGYVVSLPDILFASGKTTLRSEAEVVLAKLAGILLMVTDLTVRVEGHTDSTGNPETNQKLSEERAASVVQFLEEQGLPRERLRSVGFGADRPVADNSTAAGRKRNRRVEIVLGGPPG